jgi:hypothetical protein
MAPGQLQDLGDMALCQRTWHGLTWSSQAAKDSSARRFSFKSTNSALSSVLQCSGCGGPTSLVQQANPGAPVFPCAGRPRGFGFVVFESPEVVKKVIESKHTIDKRDVECKIAVPKEEVPTQASGADAGAKTRKIFVGGLAPTVDDQVRFQRNESLCWGL